MEYDLVTLGAGSGAPRDLPVFAIAQRPDPITADQSSRSGTTGHKYVVTSFNCALPRWTVPSCAAGGVRASRFASSKYGAKVAVVELPFGLISSEAVGGAGGTYVPRQAV